MKILIIIVIVILIINNLLSRYFHGRLHDEVHSTQKIIMKNQEETMKMLRTILDEELNLKTKKNDEKNPNKS